MSYHRVVVGAGEILESVKQIWNFHTVNHWTDIITTESWQKHKLFVVVRTPVCCRFWCKCGGRTPPAGWAWKWRLGWRNFQAPGEPSSTRSWCSGTFQSEQPHGCWRRTAGPEILVFPAAKRRKDVKECVGVYISILSCIKKCFRWVFCIHYSFSRSPQRGPERENEEVRRGLNIKGPAEFATRAEAFNSFPTSAQKQKSFQPKPAFFYHFGPQNI